MAKTNYGAGYEIRWSRAPSQSTRNRGEIFHTSPAFDSLDLICQDVSNSLLDACLYDAQAYRKDKESAKEIKDHPLLTLLRDPCPGHIELDGYSVWYMAAAYMRLKEFFLVIERNGSGQPIALYPAIPQWVVQTPSVTYPYFRVMPQGVTSAQQIEVLPQDMIWFKNPDLTDPFGRGRGRDETIDDEVESDEYAAKYQKNLFYNDGQPPIVISGDFDQPTAQVLKESWIQKVTGWINARKPMFLGATNLKIDKLTDSVREMDMVESRKALRDIFNQHYSLPPEMRGILENSNRSTIDSADYLYKKNVLSRQIKRMLQILNRQLVPQFDQRLTLVCDDLVPQDTQAMQERALKEFQAGLITKNEYCRKVGDKEESNGDWYLRPSSVVMVPASEADQVPEPVAVQPPAPNIKSFTSAMR